MSSQITTAMRNQFNANVAFQAQQKKSRLEDKVRIETLAGEKDFFDQIGSTTPVKRNGRHANTPYVETPHSRRMVTGSVYDWADLIDKPDKLKLLWDPQSPYAQNAGFAFARQKDDVIIEAIFADVYSGKDGTTQTTWASGGSGQIVAVASTNLTLAKLLAANELRLAADVDPDEEWYIAVGPKQMTSLLNTTEVKSADYNSVKALVQGQIDTFMGFKFVNSNRLLLDGNSYRRVPVWCKSGVLLAKASDVETRIDELPTKNYSTQVWASMNMGATRMEEVKVIEIKCQES